MQPFSASASASRNELGGTRTQRMHPHLTLMSRIPCDRRSVRLRACSALPDLLRLSDAPDCEVACDACPPMVRRSEADQIWSNEIIPIEAPLRLIPSGPGNATSPDPISRAGCLVRVIGPADNSFQLYAGVVKCTQQAAERYAVVWMHRCS